MALLLVSGNSRLDKQVARSLDGNKSTCSSQIHPQRTSNPSAIWRPACFGDQTSCLCFPPNKQTTGHNQTLQGSPGIWSSPWFPQTWAVSTAALLFPQWGKTGISIHLRLPDSLTALRLCSKRLTSLRCLLSCWHSSDAHQFLSPKLWECLQSFPKAPLADEAKPQRCSRFPAEANPSSSAQDHLPRNLTKTMSLKRPRETKALFAQPALVPKAFQRLLPSSSFGEHWEVASHGVWVPSAQPRCST